MKKILAILGLIITLNVMGQDSFKEADYIFQVNSTLNVLSNTTTNGVKSIIVNKSNNKVTIEYSEDIKPIVYDITNTMHNMDGSIEYTITGYNKTQFLTIDYTKEKKWSVIIHSTNPQSVYSYEITNSKRINN